MKLIDLLVQELPKRGGWPDGKTHAWQDHNTEIRFAPSVNADFHPQHKILCEEYRDIGVDDITPEHQIAVTREQYEAALAASKAEWNGEGLPPVGCDIYFYLDTDRYSTSGVIPNNGQMVSVLAHKITSAGNPVAVVYWDDNGAGRAAAFIKDAFRPIRSEADKKRDEAIESITSLIEYRNGCHAKALSKWIYEEIAAGKIHHIRID